MKAFFSSASLISPGTHVFWGAPLTNGHPSRTDATANSVDGDTSEWDALIAASRLAEVSLTPGMMSEYQIGRASCRERV